MQMISKIKRFTKSLIGQSRQDDLESLFYLLMHLLHGDLPWTQYYDEKDSLRAGYQSSILSSVLFEKIKNHKCQTSPEESWPNLPCIHIKYIN